MEINMEPILLTLVDAGKISGMSRTRLFEELGKGTIAAKKSGRRTLIVYETLKSHIENLPPAVIRAPRQAA